ncbi:hypothetical protein [Microvirga brassicacearum]|nr:hypothetical protein [Microvirga brassicacearum]
MIDKGANKNPAGPNGATEDGGYFARKHWITAEEARELVKRVSNDHRRFG